MVDMNAPSWGGGRLNPISNFGQLMDTTRSNAKSIFCKLWRSFHSWKGPRSGLLAVLIVVALVKAPLAAAIIQEHKPNSIITSAELSSQSFHGNHSHVDYFRLLQRDGNSLLIGARNYVYNISLHDLSENVESRMEWVSKKQDSDACFSKGKSEAECHNYIRVLVKKSEGQFLVCGTNAYKPMCRDYGVFANGSFSINETDGFGKSPFNPRDNSTFVYADGNLYSGTVGDFQGMIPLIIRDRLKTDHSDSRQLNRPDFVHSFEFESWVFFFFRETAVEYMNCGKRVFSRVARVCKKDKGPAQLRPSSMASWTSFLKSRLNCSSPGDYPFYFDDIQSVSDVINITVGGKTDQIIYAVFTTPPNSIPGSAVCSFSMKDVLDAFEGPFKEQKEIDSNWMRVPPSRVPEPRPGSCVNDSRTLPEEVVTFVKSHSLMDDLVSPFLGRPLIMKASFKYRFTRLTVDPQVPIANGEFVDVLFIATDVGTILKVINDPQDAIERRAAPIVVEEVYAFPGDVAVNNLKIAPNDDGSISSKLIIITDVEVKAIPLHRCAEALSCQACVAKQDPYCAWYPRKHVCGSVRQLGIANSMQNISSGIHNECPNDIDNVILRSSAAPQVQTTGPVLGASVGGPLIYSAETLAIAVTTACVAALVIGFISGFLFSRKCRGDDFPHFSETPYLDSKLNKCDASADPNMYTANNASLPPPKQINNLVTNYNPKNINKTNSNVSTDTKLIKQAKCAYI